MRAFRCERLQVKGLSEEVEENMHMSAVSLLILCLSFLEITSALAVSHRDLPETHMNVVSLRFIKFTYPTACVTELSITVY